MGYQAGRVDVVSFFQVVIRAGGVGEDIGVNRFKLVDSGE